MARLKWLLCLAILPLQAYSTYFCYSDENYKELLNLRSRTCMERNTLHDWDKKAEKALAGMPHHAALRVWTYLYQAQADAAFLSYSVKGIFAGNLDQVSAKVLSLFVSGVSSEQADPYSEKLADIVVAKVKERIAEENKSDTEFTIKGDEKDQNGEGLYIAKWQPWWISCPCEYWPCEPPAMNDNFWEWQICEIKQIQHPMTRYKQGIISYWAKTGNWRKLGNDYLFSHEISLGETLEVRSVLLTGLYDTAIVCFTAKYHYMVPRPKMIDKSVHYEIPTPKHPSYPSGHSISSSSAAVILSYFYPGESEQWHCWAQQAGLSRIWAGIHYPIDNEEGAAAGRCVAGAVLSNVASRD